MISRAVVLWKRCPLATYFFLAYLISWSIWAPLVASGQGWLDIAVSPFLYALGFMGPMAAAMLAAGMHEGKGAIARLLCGIGRCHIGVRWYIFVLLAPPLLFVLSAAIARLAGNAWPDWTLYGRLEDLFPGLRLVPSLLCHLVIVGLGEEVGWRGYALPRLQSRRSALSATAILSLFWGLWHVPTFLFDQGLAQGLGMAVGFLFATFPVAVVYTWLFNSTSGSILLVGLWSTSMTMAIGSRAAVGAIRAIMGALITAVAMAVANIVGPEHLSCTDKRTA